MKTLSALSSHLPEIYECEQCEFLNKCEDGELCIVDTNDEPARPSPKSGHKCVYWNKKNAKWDVKFQRHGLVQFIGSYKELKDAIKIAEEYENKI